MSVESLWRAEYPRLVSLLQRQYGINREDAEDVASDAFLELSQRGNVSAALLTRRAQLRAIDLLRRGEAPSLGRDDALYTTELRVDLTRAIGTLPCREREAFALTELRGLTEREAALQLGISQRTVHRRVEAARTLLRQELTA